MRERQIHQLNPTRVEADFGKVVKSRFRRHRDGPDPGKAVDKQKCTVNDRDGAQSYC